MRPALEDVTSPQASTDLPQDGGDLFVVQPRGVVGERHHPLGKTGNNPKRNKFIHGGLLALAREGDQRALRLCKRADGAIASWRAAGRPPMPTQARRNGAGDYEALGFIQFPRGLGGPAEDGPGSGRRHPVAASAYRLIHGWLWPCPQP